MVLPKDRGERELSDLLGTREASPELSNGLLTPAESLEEAKLRRALLLVAGCAVLSTIILIVVAVSQRSAAPGLSGGFSRSATNLPSSGEIVVKTALHEVGPVGAATSDASTAPSVPSQPPVSIPAPATQTATLSSIPTGGSEPCVVLWSFSVGDMVGYGFGASLKQLAFMRIWASRHSCGMVVSESNSRDWDRWSMGPVWDRTLTDDEWIAAWSGASPCGYLNDKVVRCVSPDPALVSVNWDLEDLQCDQAFLETIVKVFDPRFSNYKLPFEGGYAGLHVRHGDKAIESEIFPFKDHMDQVRERWPQLHNVFVATDDATVIKRKIGEFQREGFNVTWTKDERRWKGGSPQTAPAFQAGHHDNNEAAIAALLDDVVSLALATVLVGSFSSNFFRIAWFLNLGMHGALQRGNWCYDLFVGRACDDQKEQVLAYCQEQAKKMSCDFPRLEEVCRTGVLA